MSSSLHYIEPLQLADTFNEWFLRSNDLIDVVNNINVYNVENGWGLARYRSVGGTTTLRLNIGQQDNEHDGSGGLSSDWKYGLRFIPDEGVTNDLNPDVSTTRKILTLDFENLPAAEGGSTASAFVHEEDYFAYSDTSSGTGAIRGVQAQDMLPYGISGDHRFYGNVFFDGEKTVINSSNLWVDDINILLATSTGDDGSSGHLNDQNLDGAGMIIKGSSGDKNFTYNYQLLNGYTFGSFTSNENLLLSDGSKLLTDDGNLDFYNMLSSDLAVKFGTSDDQANVWTIQKKGSSDNAGRLIFFHENTDTSITAGALTLSKLGTIKIHELEGEIVEGGITHESSFSYLPSSFSIPTTGMSGDSHLHFKWANRKTIQHTNHGFTAGDILRFLPNGTTFEYAHKSTKETAESIAIVEDGNPDDGVSGATTDQFIAVFNGLVDLSNWTPVGWGSDGTTMTSGRCYFLDGVGNSGGFTSGEPYINGEIRKPVLIAIDETTALFANYLGNVVSTGDSDAGASGNYVYEDGYLTKPSIIPNQGHKNKIINGDFSFWQRAEDYRLEIECSSNWDGATGTRFVSSNDKFYTADMWFLDTSVNGGEAEVTKHGHTFAIGTLPNDSEFTTGSRGCYLRILNNHATENPYLRHRIENVGTLGDNSTTNDVSLSYYIKGVSSDSIDPVKVHLLQVFDGNSGEGITYAGGATSCIGTYSNGITTDSGMTAAISSLETWQKHTHKFTLKSRSEINDLGVDESYNWLEVLFELPADGMGISGGIDLARVQLEGGDVSTDWHERTLQEEENLVNRYYQRFWVNQTGYIVDQEHLKTSREWKTTPYQHNWQNSIINVVGDCVYAYGGSTLEVFAANQRGFVVGQTGDGEMSEINGFYHFDFGISGA